MRSFCLLLLLALVGCSDQPVAAPKAKPTRSMLKSTPRVVMLPNTEALQRLPVSKKKQSVVQVIKERTPRLIVFTSKVCPPCVVLASGIDRLPADWTRGETHDRHIQFVRCDTDAGLVAMESRFGVKLDEFPTVYAKLAGGKLVRYQRRPGGKITAVGITHWLVSQIPKPVKASRPVEPIQQQLVRELHRVTNTAMPMQGIDVDVSEQVGSASQILAALASGKYEPTKGVQVTSPRGLFPTRNVRQSDGSVRFHFDQRPTVTAKKWLLKINGTLQYVHLSADGKRADVSISGLPDVRLSL